MYKFLYAASILSDYVYIIFMKVLHPTAIIGGHRFFSQGGLRITLRKNGRLFLGAAKTRGGLRIFCDGGVLRISNNVFLNNNCSINCMNEIDIGEGTILGEGVKIYDHNHMILDGVVSRDQFNFAKVSIGRQCWLGSNVIILSGVIIVDDVIVGAGSIVTKSILEKGIYVGNGTMRKIG